MNNSKNPSKIFSYCISPLFVSAADLLICPRTDFSNSAPGYTLYIFCSILHLKQQQQCFLMCRWWTQPGRVMVRQRSPSVCSSHDVLPFDFWLPGLFGAARKHRGCDAGHSLPRHLYRPPGEPRPCVCWDSVGSDSTDRLYLQFCTIYEK